jgi:hypothetical protein
LWRLAQAAQPGAKQGMIINQKQPHAQKLTFSA